MVAAPDVAFVIDRRLVIVFAVAAGAAAANLYYAQPLLPTIAHAFHTGTGTSGLIVTSSQLGYAAGLAFLVPLGDLLPRRRLVPTVLVGTATALVATAVAPAIAVLIAFAAFVGLGSVIAHVVIPFGAELATDEERGRVVGTMMTGLLLGILLARTISGVLADLAGWRAVYVVAAGITVLLGVVLRRVLPEEHPRPHLPYRALLRSALRLFATEPVLRLRCIYGALSFACFSVLWTTLAFLLKAAPFHYSNSVIGLFGLVGAAGAAAANGAGRLADRGHSRVATFCFSVAMLVSFGVLAVGRSSLPGLIVGILLLDAGSNGLHVINQHTNYTLPAAADARSRINAVYMTSFFLGGASGSAAAAGAYSAWGWSGVCGLGAVLAAAAVVLAVTARRERPAPPARPRLEQPAR
ncbi:MAG: MFS transporter [Actinobacteria bacterium]|nr:MFS transporter [Actinomycetota bacterium]